MLPPQMRRAAPNGDPHGAKPERAGTRQSLSLTYSGYIALFEIEDAKTVTILAVRPQREEDYH